MSRSSRPALWQVYLGLGCLLAALYALIPPFSGSGPLMNLLGLSPVVAILLGVQIHRPLTRAPWYCFALGLSLFWLGDLYTIGYPRLFGTEVPFPSIGDGAYIAVYPVLMVGLILLVRRRNPDADRAGLIDSLIMTLGLSVVSWVLLIAPYLHEEELGLGAKLVSIAYPLGDVLLLAAIIRLAVDTGRRQPAFYLLTTSLLALLVTDFAYGLVTLAGTYDNQVWLDLGWIAFYLFWGAAALHPSMTGLERPAPERDPKLGRARLALLTCATMIAPVVELLEELRTGSVEVFVIIAASAVLFGLVVLRMGGLIRQHERAVYRERELSTAGVRLVAATDAHETYHVAVTAARSLAGDDAQARICLPGRDDEPVEVVGDGDAWSVGPQLIGTLRELSFGASCVLDPITGAALRVAPTHGCGLLLELGDLGVLVVAASARLPRPAQAALSALATQVSLALESAALTEEVHRRKGEARFSTLVQHSSDLITVLDADATIAYQSPSIEKALGFTPEEVLGTRFDRLLQPGEQSRLLHLLADDTIVAGAEAETEVLECFLMHRDGTPRQFEVLHTNLLHDEHVHGIVLNGRDISERKAFERQLEHQAFHDPVTGLANRALFGERVRHAAARSRRDGRGLAVIFLDLDDFKTVNDSLGHAAGDQALIEVAQRLATSIRVSDTAARFGGDEFAILLEDVVSAAEAAETAERVLLSLTLPFRLVEKEIFVRASLGIAVVEGDELADAEEMIRDADAAMYIAKHDGKGGYRMFEPAMHEGVLERLELRAGLQRALTNGEFELFYQPLVELRTGRVTGLEALLRWRHPERGLVAPDGFIPFAEDSGLIVPIGRWVLREGCRFASRLHEDMPTDPPISISINLSVKQLQHSDIVSDVREALVESGLEAGYLTLEITETVMAADTELAVQRLEELKQLGVRLAMDDFGTGYSSLSYLSSFPVDILKMDRSFLREGQAPAVNGLASAVVALGETLRLQVVAEGIETAEQWATLRDLGCELGQGFHFARPMEGVAVLHYLRDDLALPLPAGDPLLTR